MKIKGLVWGAALLAPFALGQSLKADNIDLTSMLDEAAAHSNCCGDSCCGMDCCDACDCGSGCGCCFAPYWYAGTEFLFMGVDATSGGRARVYADDFTTAGDESDATGAGGYDDFTYAPRLTLGRQLSENWGVQGRFFYLSDTEARGNALPTVAAPLTQSFDSRIRMYTVDLEAVRSMQGDVWKVDMTGGVRHGSIDLNSSVSTGAIFGGTDLALATASAGSSFEGTGLTSALIGRRQLGNSRASLFTGARGSVLFGDASSSAGHVVSVLDAGGGATNFNGAIGEGSTELYIIELTIGLQWDFALKSVPANAFFRTAFEYQNWDIDGDGGAVSAGIATTAANSARAASSAGAGEVDLYGLVIGTGFTW